jgi:hypothetical protein
MKMHPLITTIFFLSLIPAWGFAGWQVAAPATTVAREPFFQAGATKKVVVRQTYKDMVFPQSYKTVRLPPVYAISMSGSLKENLERILGRYHWKVVWKADYDFNFDGRVTGSSLSNVVEKLLKPFPLQAVMYMSNRTVTVMPRTMLGSANNVS